MEAYRSEVVDFGEAGIFGGRGRSSARTRRSRSELRTNLCDAHQQRINRSGVRESIPASRRDEGNRRNPIGPPKADFRFSANALTSDAAQNRHWTALLRAV